MKINTLYTKKLFTAVGLTVTLGLIGCSGQQQADEEDLQMSDDDEAEGENLGQDDANEGNGQENFVDGEDNEQSDEQQAADANSATEDFDGTNNGDQLGALDNGAQTAPNNNAPLNNTAGGAFPMNASAPMSNAAAFAPAPTDGTAPIPGGRVRYVREGGVQVVSGPGGSAVLTLDQGEHPVTWEENGMLRLHTGHYVAPESMSDLGVPRPTR